MTTFCTFYSGLSSKESLDIIKKIAVSFNWKLIKESEGELVFTSRFNWDTWGQKIFIRYVSIYSINITVKTRFSQFADSGSGSMIIKKTVEHYQELTKNITQK